MTARRDRKFAGGGSIQSRISSFLRGQNIDEDDLKNRVQGSGILGKLGLSGIDGAGKFRTPSVNKAEMAVKAPAARKALKGGGLMKTKKKYI
jgi:hypothetical protein|tara:strand:+ start:961 stop:1236 length:276 start_codon:yes stop_codon:yes gene_type:complete